MSKTGYIYKLCCNDPEITDCYVGSTKNEKVRKCGHKKCCINPNQPMYNLNVYQFIRANGGWADWNMIRLEEFKFDERAELNARERYWLETLGATLNKVIPTRTNKEYYELNKEVIAERKKVWRVKNKEVISEKNKIYRESNKKVIEEKAKIYREANKEVIAHKQKEFYQKNKQQIDEKKKEKITCECGSVVRKAEKSRHLKSKKHKDYITSLNVH
jgi:hypothetical protein